jgi:hypothetical protein
MERGSTQHGPRVDDELERETRSLVQGAPVESRVEEGFEKEGPADGEPVPDARIAGDRPPPVPAMSRDEVEARSELARHLEPHRFPARPAELVAMATEQHAPDDMVISLARLPDRTYDTVGEVWVALGGHRESRATAGTAAAAPAPPVVPEAEPEPEPERGAPAPLQLLALPAAVGLRVAVVAVHVAGGVAGGVVRQARRLVDRVSPTS